MFLVRVVESLITDVLITPENLPEPQKVFDGIIGQIKEVARSLSYLNIDDETVNEASFIVTVYIDEIMFIKYPSWPLQQIVSYKTNRGGEEFFNKLENTLERYEKEAKVEDLALIELYNFLLSLNFTGKYWNDTNNEIEKYRIRMNKFLNIDQNLRLVNVVEPVPHASKNRTVNMISIILIVFICLITVFVSCLFDDFSNQQGEMWHKISDKYIQGVDKK